MSGFRTEVDELDDGDLLHVRIYDGDQLLAEVRVWNEDDGEGQPAVAGAFEITGLAEWELPT